MNANLHPIFREILSASLVAQPIKREEVKTIEQMQMYYAASYAKDLGTDPLTPSCPVGFDHIDWDDACYAARKSEKMKALKSF